MFVIVSGMIDEKRAGLLDSKSVSLWFAAPSAPPMSLVAHRYLDMTADDHQDRSTEQKNAGKQSWQRGFANAWMVLGAAPSGLLIGYFVDRAYGTAPWWMLGLSLTFLAVSLYQLVKDSWK